MEEQWRTDFLEAVKQRRKAWSEYEARVYKEANLPHDHLPEYRVYCAAVAAENQIWNSANYPEHDAFAAFLDNQTK